MRPRRCQGVTLYGIHLVHYDSKKKLVFDNSPYGITVLSHNGVYFYALRTLNPTEKDYSQLDKEGYSIPTFMVDLS